MLQLSIWKRRGIERKIVKKIVEAVVFSINNAGYVMIPFGIPISVEIFLSSIATFIEKFEV